MKKPIKILLIAFGATVALVGTLLALACLGLFFWVEQSKTEIAENTVIQSHLGEIEKIEFEFLLSIEAEGDETLVFSIVGSKDQGQVVAEFVTVDGEHEEIEKGIVTLQGGTSYDLLTGLNTL